MKPPVADAIHFVGEILSESLAYLLLPVLVWSAGGSLPSDIRIAAVCSSAAAGFAIACFSAWRKQLQRASAAEADLKAALKAATEKRIFVDDPHTALALNSQSVMEASRVITPYFGKWIKISGRFDGLAESLQRDSIHVSVRLENGSLVNLRFATDNRDELLAIHKGQRLTAIAQIEPGRGTGEWVAFKNAEMVFIEPKPALLRAS